MPKSLHEKLTALGAPTLATQLIKLAESSLEIERLVKQMVAGPEETIALFKKQLSGIKRRKRFIPKSQSLAFNRELKELISLLADIPSAEALPLLVKLYEADAQICNQVDSSYGILGDFYSEVTAMFSSKASLDIPQSDLLKHSKKILHSNQYGCRDSFSEHLGEFLNATSLKKLFTYFESVEDEHLNKQLLLESIAQQLKDPQLFKNLVLKDTENPHNYHFGKIAVFYLDCNQPEKALEIVNNDYYTSNPPSDKLLKLIYSKLDMKK